MSRAVSSLDPLTSDRDPSNASRTQDSEQKVEGTEDEREQGVKGQGGDRVEGQVKCSANDEKKGNYPDRSSKHSSSSKELEAELEESSNPNEKSLLRRRTKAQPNQPAFILPVSNFGLKESEGNEEGNEKQNRKRSPYSPLNLFDWLWNQVKWMVPILKNWSMMKPVIRSSILAWVCLLMLLITPIEAALGQASFLVLIGAFIQPAELPLFAMLEREFFTLFLVLLAWAWSCLGLKIAYEARDNKVPASQVVLNDVFTAQYTEVKPAIVCSIFLSFGCASMLYLKIKFGPSPFLFGTILASLSMVISLTTGYLFPYPYYEIGEAIVTPLALKASLNIVFSAIFYPKSVNSQFVERLIGVLSPLSQACKDQISMFENSSPLSDDYPNSLVYDLVTKAEGALLPMSLASRLLNRELSFGLASGQDLRKLEAKARDIVPSADGWSYYQSMIHSDLTSAHLPQTPAVSRLATPAATPSVSRAATPPPHPEGLVLSSSQIQPEKAHVHLDLENEGDGRNSESSNNPTEGISRSRLSHLLSRHHSSSPSPSIFRGHHSSNHSQIHHGNLFHLPHFKSEAVPVGLWESLRAAGIENYLHTSDRNHFTEEFSNLLGESSKLILEENNKALDHAIGWLKKLNAERYQLFRNRFTNDKETNEKISKESAGSTSSVILKLEEALEKFWKEERLIVIEPMKESLFSSSHQDSIPHRYLFQVWVHQFHTQNFTKKVLLLLKHIEEIQRNRFQARIHFPSFLKFFRIQTWQSQEESGDLDDPHEIAGAPQPSAEEEEYELGKAQARDPDALAPETWLESFGARSSEKLHSLFRGNLLFFWKAAALTSLISLPSYLSSSAAWWYEQKGIWVIFMALLTLARHRGETIFSLFGRLISTFSGAAIGLLIWELGTAGQGHNAYGIATVFAVLSPLIFVVRLYPPFPPIVAIIMAVTVGLVVGYSYKDAVNPTFGSVGTGWSVAWRRFVGVVVGTTAATIFSYLPPSSTGRNWQRVSHSTTIAELGRLHCDIIGFAGKAYLHQREENQLVLKKRLAAVRAKLKRMSLATNALSYEFSFRGKWPAQRYSELMKVQMELSKLQSHLVSVTSRLGPKYSKALLRRTRFLDPLFLGDCISVISMCSTALRTGSPLPQITPCPLTDRFFMFEIGQQGLAITRDEDEDDLGLPRLINFETLTSENYMFFAVGVASAFGLIIRIDRLCLAVKELVGESFSVPSDIHRKHVRNNPKNWPTQRR